jgi:hypothetical protein
VVLPRFRHQVRLACRLWTQNLGLRHIRKHLEPLQNLSAAQLRRRRAHLARSMMAKAMPMLLQLQYRREDVQFQLRRPKKVDLRLRPLVAKKK